MPVYSVNKQDITICWNAT